MALLGKQLKLTGKTQKGKNRIREQGDRWIVLAETDKVLFAPYVAGPWIFISPEGKDQTDNAARWIRAVDDLDFDMAVVGG